MIAVNDNRAAEVLGILLHCLDEAYEIAGTHIEESVQHGCWMRVAAAIEQAKREFDE